MEATMPSIGWIWSVLLNLQECLYGPWLSLTDESRYVQIQSSGQPGPTAHLSSFIISALSVVSWQHDSFQPWREYPWHNRHSSNLGVELLKIVLRTSMDSFSCCMHLIFQAESLDRALDFSNLLGIWRTLRPNLINAKPTHKYLWPVLSLGYHLLWGWEWPYIAKALPGLEECTSLCWDSSIRFLSKVNNKSYYMCSFRLPLFCPEVLSQCLLLHCTSNWSL
jgi:hypothetical protein